MGPETDEHDDEALLSSAYPDGAPPAERRFLRSLVGHRRRTLASRLAVVIEAERLGGLDADMRRRAEERTGLRPSMLYRMLGRWSSARSLSDLVPNGRGGSTPANALTGERRTLVEAALSRALVQGGGATEIAMRAEAELGAEAPSRSALIRALRDLRARGSGPAEDLLCLDVAACSLAIEHRDKLGDLWRVQVCILTDMVTGVVIDARPCLPADIVPKQVSMLLEIGEARAAAASVAPRLRWISPVQLAVSPSVFGPDAIGSYRFLKALPASVDLVLADGYALGSSASRIGGRLGDLPLLPRRTGGAHGSVAKEQRRRVTVVSMREAESRIALALEERNAGVPDARRAIPLSTARAKAAVERLRLEMSAMMPGQDSESLAAR